MFDFLKVCQHTFWRAYFIDKKWKYFFFHALRKKTSWVPSSWMSASNIRYYCPASKNVSMQLFMQNLNKLILCTQGWTLLRLFNIVPFLSLFMIRNFNDLSIVSDAIAGDDNIRLAPSIRSKRGTWWSFSCSLQCFSRDIYTKYIRPWFFFPIFVCFLFNLNKVREVNVHNIYLLSEEYTC